MQSYFFFSDVHLGAPHCPDEAIRKQQLLDFFEYVKRHAAGLFIVGDLFDFWFEYRHAVPRKYFDILTSLYNLCHNGLEIDYVAGNHDMWMGDFLSQEIGLRVHHRGIARELHGLQCYITHGDGAARRDSGYRLMKRFLKNPINIFLYRLVPPDIGFPLALKVSRTSRTHKVCDSSWDEEYMDFAKQRFAEGCDVVMMGHTHRPRVATVGGNTFINLGDWITHFTYCELNEAGPRLKQWPSQNSMNGR